MNAAGDYVQTRPAICDINHGPDRLRAVTMQPLVCARRRKDRVRLFARDGMMTIKNVLLGIVCCVISVTSLASSGLTVPGSLLTLSISKAGSSWGLTGAARSGALRQAAHSFSKIPAWDLERKNSP